VSDQIALSLEMRFLLLGEAPFGIICGSPGTDAQRP